MNRKNITAVAVAGLMGVAGIVGTARADVRPQTNFCEQTPKDEFVVEILQQNPEGWFQTPYQKVISTSIVTSYKRCNGGNCEELPVDTTPFITEHRIYEGKIGGRGARFYATHHTQKEIVRV